MNAIRRLSSTIQGARRKQSSINVAISILALLPVVAFGVSPAQIDDFENGTTQGWTDGFGGGNVANIATGGPGGANDNYLQLSSGSFGGQPRLVTFNQSQWLGNYIAAGVATISMDLKNFGDDTIPIRIAIRQGTGGSSTPGYASTVAFDLPNDGQWHTAVFSLQAGSMTPINSPLPLVTDLANVADFRLLSSSSPATIGDVLNAQIGVDNITAVPEPSAIALAVIGMAAWRLRPRREKY